MQMSYLNSIDRVMNVKSRNDYSVAENRPLKSDAQRVNLAQAEQS